MLVKIVLAGVKLTVLSSAPRFLLYAVVKLRPDTGQQLIFLEHQLIKFSSGQSELRRTKTKILLGTTKCQKGQKVMKWVGIWLI